jgi:hypothetical protein
MKTLKTLVEVEKSKIYDYSYDSVCASDTVNLWYRFSILANYYVL